MADDEDVPPLEDMSEMLEQVKAISHNSKTNEAKSDVIKPTSASKPAFTEQPIKDLAEEEKERQETAAKQATNSNAKPASFGGMKKGFLFGGSNTSKSKPTTKPVTSKSKDSLPKSTDEIPVLKPKQSQQEERRIPEVQEAMLSDFLEKNKGAWMTDELLNQVQDNDTVMKRLSDPRFMAALTEFQTNPKVAREKYKDNPEMDEFLREFAGVMGDHLLKLGDGHPLAPPAPAPVIQSEDERRMQQILADPEVREIFNDPRIQTLFQALRTDPDNSQRYIREADPVLQKRLRKLVDVGLLQIER